MQSLRAMIVFASFPALFAATTGLGPTAFTAPGAFPTSVYKKYYNSPTATSAQPQPVISDPVLHSVYPFALTNPDTIPLADKADPHPLPPKAADAAILAQALAQIQSIAANPLFGDNSCARCLAGLQAAKFVALAAPAQGSALAVGACNAFKFSTTCEAQFGQFALGPILTQVVANADVGGLDGQALCNNFIGGLCPAPNASPLNLTGWFAKPKPSPLPLKKPSGKRLKVLHLSDLHIDPRYATGSEANCTTSLCCRSNNNNIHSPNVTLSPAPRFGTYSCDSPLALVMAAMQSIPVLTGTQKTGFDFAVYTGDLVSHDPDNELSRDYIMYTETIVYDLMRKFLGTGPVYAALGNHDTHSQAQDAQHALGGNLATQFSWNYDHVAGLWQHEGWLPDAAVKQARAEYGGYSVHRQDGLRVITLNTDFWYKANYFNYINFSNPDTSGMLRFLTDELQDAENRGEKAWIVGHVLPGWDGSNPLTNPTNLFYQIIDRFSPHVVANTFFGHTHEDQLSIFYANNATNISASTAQALAWMGPSLTPLTNLNSGFRLYEVDSSTFEILDAYTWRSDVSSFPALDHQTANGPEYVFEYSTRDAYGGAVPGWGAADPLNATWWHHVTDAMVANSSLVTVFNTFQGKESVLTPPCTGDCVTAKICYIRSASVSIAKQNCIAGFGSVQ